MTMNLAEELAFARRVAHTQHLTDLMDHFSARLPDGQGYLFTPGYGHAMPGTVKAADMVHVSADAAAGAAPPLIPAEYLADVAIYRERPDVHAIARVSPPHATALGMAGRDIEPLTHTNAELAFEAAARCDIGRMIIDETQAAQVARCLNGKRICHLPGIGMYVTGASVFDVLRVADVYEQLARLFVAAAQMPGETRTITATEYANLVAERPVEKASSRDPRRFYRSLDELPARKALNVADANGLEHGEIRAAVATSCKVLYAQGDLVAFFEHVSHRIPGRDDRFLMSPAKHFGLMEAADIGIIATDGECEPIEGPYPPAPFRWFHRDVLAARPDVNAIVHTHALYGRLVALKGTRPVGAFRNGFGSADVVPPVLDVPSLVFDPQIRRRALAELADHNVVHTITHGTDYLASTLEEATVRAIHHEQLCRAEHLAQQLGTLTPLADTYAADLRQHGPSYKQWYVFYTAG